MARASIEAAPVIETAEVVTPLPGASIEVAAIFETAEEAAPVPVAPIEVKPITETAEKAAPVAEATHAASITGTEEASPVVPGAPISQQRWGRTGKS